MNGSGNTGKTRGSTLETEAIEPPENLKPALLSTQTGTHARWLKNGQIVSHRVDTLHGSPASPLSDTEFLEKVKDCLSWAGNPISADFVLSAASEIDGSDVRTLVARLTTPIRSRKVSDGSFV